ncbi:uracil-DNA glycosylase [Desertibacillus haloalkaliphilus]|uniref:uracil-DNA glycosylase n=1 Tax=Desertibacillus haloalkaliphilus TaxID=1328930 RepID=UPI001C27AB17|nr:uracil-DNA glycosylase [Desertibacillus haloalkaliphilus]MBU8905816.1 uracil-DNA glycosylase [Desertibacillus haloalkaliphilus]
MRFVNNDWAEILAEEFEQEYLQRLSEHLRNEYQTKTIYPAYDDVFRAFTLTSYHDTKVVVLGQDPYHGEGQAHGLSFSVQHGAKQPPSLKNIFKELEADLGVSIPSHGSLVSWAKQGVLLLNTVLTVEEGKANAHKGMGWERFTDQVIKKLNERNQPVVFLLWGKHAQAKQAFITHHPIITSPHPSPLSARRGFFGSRPFSRVNEYLTQSGIEPIDWGKFE